MTISDSVRYLILRRHIVLLLGSVVLSFATLTASAQTIVTVEEGLGKVVEVDASNHSCRTEIQVGLKPHEIAPSSDGHIAYISNFGLLEANHRVGTPGKSISVIDIARGVETNRLLLPEGPLAAPHGIKLRPSKGLPTELFTNAEIGDTMIVFDLGSGKITRTFPLPPGVHNFVFSSDGAALYAFSIKGQVFKIASRDGRIEATANIASPRGVALTPDHSQLIVGGNGELLLLDSQTLATTRTFANLGVHQIFYPSVSANGKWIFAPAVVDRVVLVVDATSGQVLHRIPAASPLSVTLQADEKTAWISDVHVLQQMQTPGSQPAPGEVTALDLSSFLMTPLPGVVDANGLAVSPIRQAACKK